MTVLPPPIPVRLPSSVSTDGILRAAAQLVAGSAFVGGIAAAVFFLLAFAFPLLFFVAPVWLMLPPAAAAGGVGAAAMLVVSRALRWRLGVEAYVVPVGGFLLSIPALITFATLAGAVAPVGAWLWIPTALIAPLVSHRRERAHPIERWRPVVVRLTVALVIALATLAGAAIAGPATSTLFALYPAARAPAPVPQEEMPDADPGTGSAPGDAGPPGLPLPTLDEARRQFDLLAAEARAAAGPRASWSEATPLSVVETACDGGIRLSLNGEFSTGVITDTTSDEHDREVTDGNVAAAERIVAAWQAAGLGTVERLHDEPHLGGGSLGAVDSAKIDFEFGIVLPSIEGHCLPLQ